MDNTKEEWRSLSGLGFYNYAVSSLGRVKRINQYNRGEDGILKQSETRHGYLQVSLYDGRGHPKHMRVNRLIALAFIPPDQLTCEMTDVCHKDNNKQNNAVINLCFESHKTNCRMSINGKRVNQYTLEGELVHSYDYLIDAAKQLGVSPSTIKYHCKNGKALHGYFFEYDNENNSINNNKDGYNEQNQGKRP